MYAYTGCPGANHWCFQVRDAFHAKSLYHGMIIYHYLVMFCLGVNADPVRLSSPRGIFL